VDAKRAQSGGGAAKEQLGRKGLGLEPKGVFWDGDKGAEVQPYRRNPKGKLNCVAVTTKKENPQGRFH